MPITHAELTRQHADLIDENAHLRGENERLRMELRKHCFSANFDYPRSVTCLVCGEVSGADSQIEHHKHDCLAHAEIKQLEDRWNDIAQADSKEERP